MNFIVGFILELSGMHEEESFWFVVNLFTKKTNLYFGMFIEGFLLLKFFTYSFHFLLDKEIPELEKYLKKNKIFDEFWIFSWYLTLFSQTNKKDFLL